MREEEFSIYYLLFQILEILKMHHTSLIMEKNSTAVINQIEAKSMMSWVGGALVIVNERLRNIDESEELWKWSPQIVVIYP